MKKLLFSAFMLVTSVAFFSSCQKEAQPVVKQSLESKLSTDENFKKMLTATASLSSSLTEAITADDAAKIAEILNKKDKATEAELAFVTERLGNTPQLFLKNLTDFATSFNELEKTYALSKLSKTELTNLVNGAFAANPELKNELVALNANGKAGSVGAGICRLAVSLASLFGGGALCTAINVSTIPVIGGVLCSALLGVATNILNAACDLIP